MTVNLHEVEIHTRIVREARKVSSELAAALAKSGPVTLVRRNSGSLPEYLCRVVVGQQLSTGAARTIWSRVQRLAHDEGIRIPKLASGDCVAELRRCGVSRQKVAALADIARAYSERRLGVSRLECMSHEARSERLREIRGIGQWTCDMTSIFYFGDPDVWPSGDLSVTKEFNRFVGDEQITGVVERFRPYRSYLAVSMYRLRDG